MKTLWEEYLVHSELIGNSPAIYQIRRALTFIGKSDQNVLISGEPGTEKLLIAKLIIDASPRNKAPVFIGESAKLNVNFEQEIAATLLRDNRALPDAIAGTLVLQNLDYLDKRAQTRLTGLVQGGYLELEDVKAPIAVDLRILCTASNRLSELVESDAFDPELYLALSALMLKIPSLQERKQDILALFDYHVAHFCAQMERPTPPMPFEVFHQILKYHWPGNVKEMENVVRSLIANSREGELCVEALPFVEEYESFQRLELANLNTAVSRLEKEMIERALRRFAGNQSRAAQVLQLSEPNLRFKMKKLGILKEDFVMGNE